MGETEATRKGALIKILGSSGEREIESVGIGVWIERLDDEYFLAVWSDSLYLSEGSQRLIKIPLWQVALALNALPKGALTATTPILR